MLVYSDSQTVLYFCWTEYTGDPYFCSVYTSFWLLTDREYTFVEVNHWKAYSSGWAVCFAAYTYFGLLQVYVQLWTGWYTPGLELYYAPEYTYWIGVMAYWYWYPMIGDSCSVHQFCLHPLRFCWIGLLHEEKSWWSVQRIHHCFRWIEPEPDRHVLPELHPQSRWYALRCCNIQDVHRD